MSAYLALLVAGALFGLLFTPLVRLASTALGLVDAPGGRKVHSTAVPRTGSIAICAAATAALLIVFAFAADPAVSFAPLRPVLFGAVLVLGVGLIDDVIGLSAWPKLAVQTIAAGVVVGSGLLIERLTISGATWQLGWWSYPLSLAWLITLTNAFNLIDGIDGLAVGIAAIAGTACAVILIARGHTAEAMLLTALVGAALGFLVFNFAPASIFLGDGGSLLFGFLLGATAITGWQKGATALATAVPLLIFALPLTDAGAALVRRALRRRSHAAVSLRQVVRQIVEPDREHIHHRLVALGLSTRGTVLLLYLMTFVLSLVAVLTARFD